MSHVFTSLKFAEACLAVCLADLLQEHHGTAGAAWQMAFPCGDRWVLMVRSSKHVEFHGLHGMLITVFECNHHWITCRFCRFSASKNTARNEFMNLGCLCAAQVAHSEPSLKQRHPRSFMFFDGDPHTARDMHAFDGVV